MLRVGDSAPARPWRGHPDTCQGVEHHPRHVHRARPGGDGHGVHLRARDRQVLRQGLALRHVQGAGVQALPVQRGARGVRQE